MKNKIIFSLIIFVAFLLVFCCSVNAANVLIISEEDTVQGDTVATMLGQIAPDSFTIEEVPIANNTSLSQTVAGMSTEGKTFDSVIVQLPYESIVSGDASVTECVSAIKSLYTQIGSTENTQYYIGTPAGKISNYDEEVKISEDAVEKIIDGLTTVKVTKIPVFENLKAATEKSLEVYSNNKLTKLGNLLVACTYSDSMGKKVSDLTSYPNLEDDDIGDIVETVDENTGEDTVFSDTESIAEISDSPTEETANTSNNTNNENTTNTTNVAEDKENVEVSEDALDYVVFRNDREPRLTYIEEEEYLYIEIRDMAGIACEYPSYHMRRKV